MQDEFIAATDLPDVVDFALAPCGALAWQTGGVLLVSAWPWMQSSSRNVFCVVVSGGVQSSSRLSTWSCIARPCPCHGLR